MKKVKLKITSNSNYVEPKTELLIQKCTKFLEQNNSPYFALVISDILYSKIAKYSEENAKLMSIRFTNLNQFINYFNNLDEAYENYLMENYEKIGTLMFQFGLVTEIFDFQENIETIFKETYDEITYIFKIANDVIPEEFFIEDYHQALTQVVNIINDVYNKK